MRDMLETPFEAKLRLDRAVIAPQIVPGPEGPGLVFRGAVIHDSQAPSAEARRWVAAALPRGGRPGAGPEGRPAVALVFGLGLGWHLRALKELFPETALRVFEPDRSLTDVYEKYNVLAQGQEPEIFFNFDEFEAMVGREAVHGEGGRPIALTTPGYKRLWPHEAERFERRMAMEISRREVIDKTRALTCSSFMNNLALNAGLAARLPDVMLLRGRLPRRAAFVVGAGPSLARNGRLLAQVGDRGVIICASAALKPLLALGVSPHVIVTLESSDTSAYLRLTDAEKAVLGPDALLAAASSSHPAHFEVPDLRRSLFHLNGGEAQLLGQGLFLPQGGNAGTAAFSLAYFWGLSPLVLVGQDQAYEGTLLHAPGVMDNVVELDRGTVVTVPAVGGGETETNTSLLASVNWYVEAAKAIWRKPMPPALINATASGAALQGFAEKSLEDVLLGLPAAPKLDLGEMLSGLPKPSVQELRGDIKQMSGLLSQLKRLLHSDVRRCLAEMVNVSQASAFLAQILAPALASGRKDLILKNLIWADGLLLRMLSSL
ncbi:MAG: DUF115 domain-containing protein [Deltaproteobacteria bacterium]|jgi:hypothetical protein|nr:DUF115 domain-containing protein [Deltaproteobacteria bacterium]